MKKLISLIILTGLFFVLSSSFAYAKTTEKPNTEFTLKFYDHQDGTVDLEINTNYTTGVGALHIELTTNQDEWTIDTKRTKSFAKKSNITAEENRIAFMWDSGSGSALSEKLFQTTLHAQTETYDASKINIEVLDYFDDTIQMRDLSYGISMEAVLGQAKPLYSVWLILLSMLLLLAVVVALFSLSLRWRFAALCFLVTCKKKLYRLVQKYRRPRKA
ncbi:MAG: hypothetical protein IJW78_02220 [Clostridia bacterium]|nr:hypothetical protein [Clostridia bacterium]